MTLGPLIADINGVELTAVDREVLQHPKLGGLIFFARNFEDKDQMRDLVRSIREVRPDLLLCVDQEGGRVQRFKNGFTRLPPMSSIRDFSVSASMPAELLSQELGWLMASELAELDVDHSFAPVLDVYWSESSVIGDRAFSDNPDEITELAGAFIEGMSQAGFSATAKHFPGHGGVTADSHVELPEDDRTYDDIFQRDLIPFQALKNQYKAVMTAHIAFNQVDSEPVSFSPYWIREVLRKQLEYTGLVLSDDLSMKGAETSGSFQERAATALCAGCDVVLICNQRDQAERVLEFLERNGLGEAGKLHLLKRRTKASSSNDDERKLKILNAIQA